MDIPSLLQQVPPGVDAFDFLSQMLADQVYPSLGLAFQVQVYLVPALCCIVIALIAAGLFVRWRKGRLHCFVVDGAATRPNPRLWVPVLWLIAAVCVIVHTFWIRSAMNQRHLTYGLGLYWWTLAFGVTSSYAVIAASAMCSAPLVRRGLIRLNAGKPSTRFSPAFIVVHASLFAVIALAIGSTFVAGALTGSSFQKLHEGYTGLQTLFAQAKATGDMSIMAAAGTYAAILEKASDENRQAIVWGGAVFSTHIAVFALFGLVPSLFLNIYMKKRIHRLEQGLSAQSHQHSASLPGEHIVPMPPAFKPMLDSTEVTAGTPGDGILPPRPRVQLPKDRPFANLAPSSGVPRTYANIFQAQVDPQEKARRLKAALRRDNLQLIAYFLMLGSLASLSFFQAAKGPWSFDTKQQFLAAYTWEVWSYLAPAMILALAFLYDAVISVNREEEVDPPTSFPGRGFLAPPLASIQLSQTVEVIEEHPLEEKKLMYEKFGHDST